MKKFSAAGTLVAASAAVALVGFGAPAFASASSATHGMRPVLTGHVLSPTHAIEHVVLGSAAPNRCDGDGDSDDVSCGVSGHGIRPHAYRHHTNIWRPSIAWHASTTGYGAEHFHGPPPPLGRRAER